MRSGPAMSKSACGSSLVDLRPHAGVVGTQLAVGEPAPVLADLAVERRHARRVHVVVGRVDPLDVRAEARLPPRSSVRCTPSPVLLRHRIDQPRDTAAPPARSNCPSRSAPPAGGSADKPSTRAAVDGACSPAAIDEPPGDVAGTARRIVEHDLEPAARLRRCRRESRLQHERGAVLPGTPPQRRHQRVTVDDAGRRRTTAPRRRRAAAPSRAPPRHRSAAATRRRSASPRARSFSSPGADLAGRDDQLAAASMRHAVPSQNS